MRALFVLFLAIAIGCSSPSPATTTNGPQQPSSCAADTCCPAAGTLGFCAKISGHHFPWYCDTSAAHDAEIKAGCVTYLDDNGAGASDAHFVCCASDR